MVRANAAAITALLERVVQQILVQSQTWRALPGCLHGLPQSTLLGQFYVGPVGDGLGQLDQKLTDGLADLTLSRPEVGGALGLLHRVARLAAAAQSHFSHPISSAYRFMAREQADEDGRAAFDAALPYHHAASALAAINWSMNLVNAALSGEIDADDVGRQLAELGKTIRPAGLKGINTVHFVRAAHKLGIPAARHVHEVYRFGTGVHSRALLSSLTDRTPALGLQLARDKWKAAQILGAATLPTGRPIKVHSPDEAVVAAARIGFPVVLKPNDADSGAGVRSGLATEFEVRAAFPEAAAGGRQVLIEKHCAGRDYRLTVLGDEVIKVERRIACSVVGDGSSTVADLVERKQASAHLRRIARETGKIPLALDQEALGLLASEGLNLDSVPTAGRRVPLRRQCNISTGGEQVAMALSDVHAENAALAVRAARLLFLDLAGVDLIVPDIRRSWREQGGIICEVNGIPQVGVRTSPGIYCDMLHRLMGEHARIPAHLMIVSDDDPGDPVSISRVAERLGCNGIASAEGIWIDGQLTGGVPANAFVSASSLLRDPDVRSALCVISATDVLGRGLPLDLFDLVILAEPMFADQLLLDALRPHAVSIVGATAYA